MKQILEYSELQGAFHSNLGYEREETNTYRTLGSCTHKEAGDFIRMVRKRYPQSKLNFNFVKELFDQFINK